MSPTAASTPATPEFRAPVDSGDGCYWSESAPAQSSRPPAADGLEADVAILGAGFTGLWTAYELLRRRPGWRVVVLEAEEVGFGASGRNGGWCVPELNAGPALLRSRLGVAPAEGLERALKATVGEVAEVLERERIDAEFERSGMLLVARGRGQLDSLRATWREYREAGLESQYQWLEPAGCRELIDIAGVEAGIYNSCGAAIHPGKLVRGLAEAVERMGGVIYEHSRVRRIRLGPTPELELAQGRVRAGAAVLGLEAYLTQLPGYHRRLLPIYSLICLTEPLSGQQLAAVNWGRRVLVSSMRLTVDYLSRTRDGRAVVGGRGAPYLFGSAIPASGEHHAATHQQLRDLFRSWFPALEGVGFTHAWGGVLGMPRDWIPEIGFDPASGLGYAFGYTGHGVATSNLAGRTLADLVCGSETELTRLPLVGHRCRDWEPEPLRWLGVRFVQSRLAGLDRRAEETGRSPSGRSLAERMAAH